MKLKSELMNATKKLALLESQLERTLLLLLDGKYEDGCGADFDDIRYAKDRVIDAREALEGRIQ